MRPLSALILIAGLAVCACGRDKVVAANCRADDDCQAGYLCENYQCVPKDAKNCDNILDGNPILQPTPHTVEFGTLDSQAALLQSVTLHNIGNCTLTLFEASLHDTAQGFTCDLCDTTFPKEIFPGRAIDVNIGYAPSKVAENKTELVLLSDDHEYPTLRVPVRATYIGTPQLVAAPATIDFGYVAQGRLGKQNVELSNLGTGTAPVIVQSVALTPAGTTDFALVMPTNLPRTLLPISADKSAVETIEVRYTPRSNDTHNGELVITTNRGLVKVPLTGTATTPPSITVNPMMIDIGDVTLGTSNFKTLTIVNGGGATLTVTPHWGGSTTSTDLYTTPQVIPPVAGGKYVEMQVAVTATQTGEYNSILVLETNDPEHPSVSIPVRARGIPGPGPEVVKVEMTFDNGTDGIFDEDIRNVDLTLEHPYGYVCNKTTPAPMNWGNFGTCSWLAFPPKEEPERVVLANAMQDGTWRVMVNYQQDCKSLPTALLAGILGISIDVLQQVLAGGVIVPGKDIGQIIQNICFDHSSSAVSLKVFVNGKQIAERASRVGKKGESVYVLDLVRANDTFSVK